MSDTQLYADTEHHDSKFHAFVQLALILAIITGIEIVIIFLPFPAWFVITSLIALSVVKFMFVIFYFMHLRWDKPFCTILFFIGLVVAAGTMWALIELFRNEESKPVDVNASVAQHCKIA